MGGKEICLSDSKFPSCDDVLGTVWLGAIRFQGGGQLWLVRGCQGTEARGFWVCQNPQVLKTLYYLSLKQTSLRHNLHTIQYPHFTRTVWF